MLITSVLLGTTGQFLLKFGLTATGGSKEVGAAALVGAVKSITNPLVFLGFVCYGLSSVVWMMILKKVPLNIAYPMISISYVLVVALSPKLLGEQVRWPAVLGLIFIVSGVSLIGLGLGAKH
jgi:multidrug transporter EmrE-like cation transporter